MPSKAEILKLVKENDVEFIRLWFTDLNGILKSFSIGKEELEGALEQGMGFDGSSITGFQDIEESDMIAMPDPDTFRLLPWRPREHQAVGRMFCDVLKPEGNRLSGYWDFCGLAGGLVELVIYRVVQGACGAPLVPLAQAIVLNSYPQEKHGFATKFGLSNLTVVVDYNDMQISGRAHDIMPVNIRENYLSDGWAVREIDGHDVEQIEKTLKSVPFEKGKPSFVIARTVKGRGVKYMENTVASHYRCVPDDKLAEVYEELGVADAFPV